MLIFWGILFSLSSAFSVENSFRLPAYAKIDQKAFKIGEKLEFTVYWEKGISIAVGDAIMEVRDYDIYQGRSCYRIVVTAKSYPVISIFYTLKTYIESCLDVEGLFPLYTKENTYEGGRIKHYDAEFNYAENKVDVKVYPDDGRGLSLGELKFTEKQFAYDSMAAFYFLRTQPFPKSGEKLPLTIFSDLKVKTVEGRAHQVEKLDVDAGEIETMLVEAPVGPISTKKSLFVWLTNDYRKIPVLLKSEANFGRIRAELKKLPE